MCIAQRTLSGYEPEAPPRGLGATSQRQCVIYLLSVLHRYQGSAFHPPRSGRALALASRFPDLLRLSDFQGKDAVRFSTAV